MVEKTPETEFRDAYASDAMKTIWDEFLGLHQRLLALEARVAEYHPNEARLDAILSLLAQGKPQE